MLRSKEGFVASVSESVAVISRPIAAKRACPTPRLVAIGKCLYHSCARVSGGMMACI